MTGAELLWMGGDESLIEGGKLFTMGCVDE